jgi:hypothetical protein
MARLLVEKYVFTPGAANVGTVKFPGKCELNQLLIITNKTAQTNIYALGDPTRGGSISYDPDDESFYSHEQGATTVTLDYATDQMLSTDSISIYMDAPKHLGTTVRPHFFGVDAIERIRVSNPESLIDADFEYGLQPTKWQNYSDIRNMPAIYEKAGLDIFVTNVTSDGNSPSTMTVTCSADHGLLVKDPFFMYGLSNADESARAEGSFIVSEVPSSTTFKYVAKGPIGNADDSVYTTNTYARRAAFYTDSKIVVAEADSDTVPFESNGSSPSTITVTTAKPHGIMPGTSLAGVTQSTDDGNNNHNLCTGVFFVLSVPTPTTLTFQARVGGAVDDTDLELDLYVRTDSYVVHRPFDGGIQLGAFTPTHSASVCRQSKKYFRYQSGKGVLWSSGISLNPILNLDQISADSTSIGATITVQTELDHGLQPGASIDISGVVTSGYNGQYGVASVISENTFTVVAGAELGATDAIITNRPRVTVKNWHGASVRVGPFDQQNGLFWEFDGQELAVVKRSSTFQLSGFVTLTNGSQEVTGQNCRFTQQIRVGENVVLKGMSYKVVHITGDNTMSVAPAFRGVSSNLNKVTLTIDERVTQDQFNYDKVDGTGASGYKVNLNKMQMFGISFSWYGAGFIDFMLRGSDGNFMMVHRMKSNNINDEAYMRSGNIPVRYEAINESAIAALADDIDSSQTNIELDDASRFPASGGTVLIENEIITYTGKTNNILTGCTRSANHQFFVAGSTRTFTAGNAAAHTADNGNQSVILISSTVAPILSHWGSSMILDGGFDQDRGYFFNYPELNVSLAAAGQSGDAKTVMFIRLAPSVSNSISGALGDRELVNRATVLMQKLQYQSDQPLQIYGILNPLNILANTLSWQAVNQVSLGSQPSFAEIAGTSTTVAEPGEQIFSALGSNAGVEELDLSRLKEISNSVIGGDNTFPDGPDVLAIVVKNLGSSAATVNTNLFWSESQA